MWPSYAQALSREARLTTAKAANDVRVLQIEELGLSEVERVQEAARRQLPAIPLFLGLPPEKLAAIVPLVGQRKFAAGEVIIEHGRVPSFFCILTHGKLEVVLANGLSVAKLTAKDRPVFGEMGLLANKPAVASVLATSTSYCLTISRTDFMRFLESVHCSRATPSQGRGQIPRFG